MKNKLSIRKLYITTSTIIALLFLIISYHNYFDTKEKYQNEITNINETTTKNIILSFRYEESTLNILGKELLRIDAYNNPEKGRALVEDLIKINKGLVAFGLARYDGQLILVSSLPKETKLPNLLKGKKSKESFLVARDSNKMLLGRTYFMKSLKQWVIPIRLAVKDEKGQVPLVMTAGIKIDGGETALNINKLPANATLKLVRTDQYIQFQNPIDKSKLKELFNLPIDIKIFNKLKALEHNLKHLTSIIYLEELGLYSVVSVPMSKVYNEFRIHFFMIMGLFILILVFLHFVFKKSIKNQMDYNKKLESKVIEKTQKLFEKQKQFEDIVKTINDFVWEVDTTGVYTYASPQIKKILGYETKEVIGKSPFDLMDIQERDKASKLFISILKKEKPITQLRNKNLHKNGSVVYLETSGNPIYNEEGNLIGYRGTDRDITKKVLIQKELEQNHKKIKELNKNLKSKIIKEVQKNHEKDSQIFAQSKLASMGDMIANIAHQWRQPLSAISMTASGVKLNYEFEQLDTTTLPKEMDKIVEQTQYLSDTVDTFIGFLKEKKEFKKVNLKETLNRSIQIVQSSLDSNYIKIEEDFEAILDLEIKTIPTELQEVMINIMNNAKDAIKEKKLSYGFIKIKALKKNMHIIISVEDNAGGIPEKIIDRVFEPYFTTKYKSQGTGLGLHIAYRVVTESLNGTICVKNSKNGALFIIELPIIKI